MSTHFPDSTPLGQARAWLRARLDKGADCPLCTQRAQTYRRKINAGMARSLIAMYQINGLDWVHVPSQLSARSREEGKLAYWGLVEERDLKRDDGGRAGEWRVTPRGEQFLRAKISVPKYAHVFNGRVMGFDMSETITVKDALGDKFDYSELMAGI